VAPRLLAVNDVRGLVGTTLKESNQTMIQKLLHNFNRLKLRFNRLFIPVTETKLTQTIIRSLEKERFTQQVYIGSLNLELHPVLRTTSEFH